MLKKIETLQKEYELFKVAKGHIDGIDVMLDGRVGEPDDSFVGWLRVFREYPLRWRKYQMRRFGIEK